MTRRKGLCQLRRNTSGKKNKSQPSEAKQACVRGGNSGFVLYALPEPSFPIYEVLKRVYAAEVRGCEGSGGSLAGER